MTTSTEKIWRPFFVGEIFKTIQRGKRLKTADHIQGNVPYVSSSAQNNGVDDFVGNEANVRKFKDCLTIANSGSVGKCFYHPYEFVASDHVTALSSPNLNKYHYLFLATQLERLQEKYNFNREMTDARIRHEKIMLPVDDDGSPDFVFMENYVRALEEKILQRYRLFAQEKFSALETKKIPPLNEKIWRTFLVKDLFRLESGKCSQANQLKKSADGVPYIGATNRNNGVLDFVHPVEKLIQRGNCIAFIKQGEGSVGYSVYKKENFIASTSVALGYADFLNEYVGMFITTVADKVRGRYSYNYPRSEARLRREKLMLPVNDEGAPDFEYMEAYAKNLEAEKYRKYLAYIGGD